MNIILGEWSCYALFQWMIQRREVNAISNNLSTYHREDYQSWRDTCLRRKFDDFFSAADVNGCDVIDFGGGRFACLTRPLLNVSVLGEGFIACTVYDIRKPE